MVRAGAMSSPAWSISRSPTRASGPKRTAEPGSRTSACRVSGRRRLDESLIATGIPFAGAGDPAEWSAIYNALASQVAGIRRFGAAALDLAWVAAGRYEGFWESGLQPWDTAAGCLLVREAGGFVTDWRGRSQAICDVQVLAGNDAIHSRMHKLVAEAIKA